MKDVLREYRSKIVYIKKEIWKQNGMKRETEKIVDDHQGVVDQGRKCFAECFMFFLGGFIKLSSVFCLYSKSICADQE